MSQDDLFGMNYHFPPELIKIDDFSQLNVFKTRVNEFNRKFNADVQTQKRQAKWAIGTYDKVKDMATRHLFPHWFKKGGARTIKKLREKYDYSFNKMFSELENLDNDLKNIRMNYGTLDEDVFKDSGNAYLENLIELTSNYHILGDSNNFIQDIHISKAPYFVTDDRYSSSCINRYPSLDRDGKISHFLNPEIDSINVDENDVTPDSLWVNITFTLKNISLELMIPDGEVMEYPWGDMHLVFSFNLMDSFIKSTGRSNVSDFRMLGGVAYPYPNYPQKRHPFISHADKMSPTEHHFDTMPELDRFSFFKYDIGNMCLGDFKFDFLKHLRSLNLKTALIILRMWASQYALSGTTPLNGIEKCTYGIPKMAEDSINKVRTMELLMANASISRCRTGINISTPAMQDAFIKSHCDNCCLQNRCKVFDKVHLNDADYTEKYKIISFNPEKGIEYFNSYKDSIINLLSIRSIREYADLPEWNPNTLEFDTDGSFRVKDLNESQKEFLFYRFKHFALVGMDKLHTMLFDADELQNISGESIRRRIRGAFGLIDCYHINRESTDMGYIWDKSAYSDAFGYEYMLRLMSGNPQEWSRLSSMGQSMKSLLVFAMFEWLMIQYLHNHLHRLNDYPIRSIKRVIDNFNSDIIQDKFGSDITCMNVFNLMFRVHNNIDALRQSNSNYHLLPNAALLIAYSIRISTDHWWGSRVNFDDLEDDMRATLSDRDDDVVLTYDEYLNQ